MTCCWSFGAHLDCVESFQTKLDFFASNHFGRKHLVFLGQKIKFCLKWSKRVQMGPKWPEMAKNMLYWSLCMWKEPAPLDNLYHFYWTPMCQTTWAGVSPSPILKLTQYIQLVKSEKKSKRTATFFRETFPKKSLNKDMSTSTGVKYAKVLFKIVSSDSDFKLFCNFQGLSWGNNK